MKAEGRTLDEDSGDWIYRLSITNLEVRYMFQKMIRRWFGGQKCSLAGLRRRFDQG